MKVFDGLRVIDLTWGVFGPTCLTQFSLMGAEVIKVETRNHPDFVRVQPAPAGLGKTYSGLNQCPSFNDQNFNKLSITLDVATPKGIELMTRLIKISDVFAQGFTPGVTQKLGFDYETVRKIKPDIIYLSVSAFGDEGPESRNMGYAPLFAAYAGWGDLTGYPDGPPSEIRVTGDSANSYLALVHLLAALIWRQKSGKGQYLDYSAAEGIATYIGESIVEYSMTGRVPQRNANLDSIMAPHNCYRCEGDDQWISIVISTEEEWKAFCKAIGRAGLVEDEKFNSAYKRWCNQKKLDAIVEEWTINHTKYEVMDILQKVGVAAIASFTNKDLLEDPHCQERGLYGVVEHPETGARLVLRPTWRLSVTPSEITRHSPLIGQDNEYVFQELLGLSGEEMGKLVDDKIIF